MNAAADEPSEVVADAAAAAAEPSYQSAAAVAAVDGTLEELTDHRSSTDVADAGDGARS